MTQPHTDDDGQLVDLPPPPQRYDAYYDQYTLEPDDDLVEVPR